MAKFPVDHSKSAELPDGIAKNVLVEFEKSVYALLAVEAEAVEEGVDAAVVAKAREILNDEVAFWAKINALITAALDEAQPIYDEILKKLQAVRIAALKAKADGYEPDVPESVTLGSVYSASRLDSLLWAAIGDFSDAAGLLGLKVPSWTIALASKRTQDPDIQHGNRNSPDVLKSEAGAGSGGIGIGGGNPFDK